jgi:predicted metal-dependent HD superfamily phosphohydrolase
MSVNFHCDEATHIITLRVSGKVSRREFMHYSSLVDALIAEHGTLRLLVILKEFQGLSAAAFFEDLRFDFRHRDDLERVAVVAEKRWQKGLARFFGTLNHGTLRVFDADVEDDAWDWVHEAIPAGTVLSSASLESSWDKRVFDAQHGFVDNTLGDERFFRFGRSA